MTKDDRPIGARGGKRPGKGSRVDRPAAARRPTSDAANTPARAHRAKAHGAPGTKPFRGKKASGKSGAARPPRPSLAPVRTSAFEGERIAKAMARAGLCSRREAEDWIRAGRVSVNGTVLETPALTVTASDEVLVDGQPLPARERTRLWLYHKPRGLVTTTHDPEGRETVFDHLPDDLPRVMAVGRLDINTEGLLLLTNDGGLSRILELPATGWLRRYRVRAYGRVTQAQLDALADGIAIDGVLYGAIEASLDKEQGDNVWLTLGLREGKNREVKRVLEHLGLTVNRLIRVSFGPFQLADLAEGEVREIRGRVLRDQLGERLAEEAGLDFDIPPQESPAAKTAPATAPKGRRRSGEWLSAKEGSAAVAGRKTRKADRPERTAGSGRPAGSQPRPGRRERAAAAADESRAPRPARPQKVSPRSAFRTTAPQRSRREDQAPPPAPARRIWGEDGEMLEDKRQNERTARPAGKTASGRSGGPKARPERDGGERPTGRGGRPAGGRRPGGPAKL